MKRKDARDFAKATLVIKGYARVQLSCDLEIGELEMPSASTLYLNGHTLTIRSHKHKVPGSTATKGLKGTIDYGGGQIVWRLKGMEPEAGQEGKGQRREVATHHFAFGPVWPSRRLRRRNCRGGRSSTRRM